MKRDSYIVLGEGATADKLIGCSVDPETGYYFLDIYQLGEPRPYGWVSSKEYLDYIHRDIGKHCCSLVFAPARGAEVLRGIIKMLEVMLAAMEGTEDVGFE